MTSVIGDQDSGWISMTDLTEKQKKVLEGLKPKTISEQYAESMLGPRHGTDTVYNRHSVSGDLQIGPGVPTTNVIDYGQYGTTVQYGPGDVNFTLNQPKDTKTSPKTLDSSHKIPVNLCPASAIIAIALVIAQGHKKPGRTIYNWRSQPISYMDYHAAALRHLLRSIDGHDHDEELSELADTPIRHDWAAMSCLAIIEDARQCGTLVDDRPIKGGADDFLKKVTPKYESR